MRIIRHSKTMHHLVQQTRIKGKTIGFVPTMGFLHDGHRSLFKKSKSENDLTVLSIFVNPKQFAAHEDFHHYPRDEKKDELLAKKEKVDIIFHPSIEEIYPEGYSTYVLVEKLDQVLCGKSRPGHFRGVTTVVAKLLNIVSPNILYLGQKDAQQAIIIRKMVNDLNFPVIIKILPTIRERDGLAMSSRNSYLNPSQRQEAMILFQVLHSAEEKILSGERNVKRIVGLIRMLITKNTLARIDYIECVDADTLHSLERLSGRVLIALAVWFGNTRLIDNITVRVT